MDGKVGLFRQWMCGTLLQMAGSEKEEVAHLGQDEEAKLTLFTKVVVKKGIMNAASDLHIIPKFLVECHPVSRFTSVCVVVVLSRVLLPLQRVSSAVHIVSCHILCFPNSLKDLILSELRAWSPRRPPRDPST